MPYNRAMRLLLIRLSALGDVVHTWPLAVALKALDPAPELTWVVEEPLLPLVEGHPAVDRAIPTATRRWRQRLTGRSTRRELSRLGRALRSPRRDLCLDPQGTMKSAAVCRLSRAEHRVGLARPWRRETLAGLAYTAVVRPAAASPHVVATNLELLRAAGGHPPETPTAPDGRWLLGRAANPLGRAASTSYAVLLPGTGQPSKIVPAEVLAETARTLAERGLEPVVAWGPGEKERADRVAELAGDGTRVAPPTGLLELAAMLGEAALVVGGDTGPVHLAASLGTPTVGVFMATNPLRNGPLGARVAVVSTARPPSSQATGSARAEPGPPPPAPKILQTIDRLLGS
ncbi:MAG TPA: lipopolysaccharide heptosyltransferase I [Acidobacteria bacterium]|nr:lipopolysaccharide heptosyltransferase I [Acidobacteriota bacterium]